ncbi:MAG: hypothetical protein IH585_04040 [Anaerolineaceae bacterium]|nr:hypothetical protein [Anaerolineaceae bacterium]
MNTFDFIFDEAADSHDPEFPNNLDEQQKQKIKEAVSSAEQEISEEQLMEGLEELEKILPNEPVEYEGEIEGVGFSMTVDFQAASVKGELSLDGDDYAQAEVEGEIQLESLMVGSVFSGVTGSKEYGMEFPWSGRITGYFSEDLITFFGTIVDDEGTSIDFVARQ